MSRYVYFRNQNDSEFFPEDFDSIYVFNLIRTGSGDSGGPFVCRSNANPNESYLAGIVSHGEGKK